LVIKKVFADSVIWSTRCVESGQLLPDLWRIDSARLWGRLGRSWRSRRLACCPATIQWLCQSRANVSHWVTAALATIHSKPRNRPEALNERLAFSSRLLVLRESKVWSCTGPLPGRRAIRKLSKLLSNRYSE
jgi:hypothetical protein